MLRGIQILLHFTAIFIFKLQLLDDYRDVRNRFTSELATSNGDITKYTLVRPKLSYADSMTLHFPLYTGVFISGIPRRLFTKLLLQNPKVMNHDGWLLLYPVG